MNRIMRNSSILTTIILLTLGLVFVIEPKLSLNIISTLIAAGFMVFAFTRLVTFIALKKSDEGKFSSAANLLGAIATAAISVYLFMKPGTISAIIPLIIGITVIAEGVILICCGVFWNAFLPRRGLISIAIGILNIVLGMIILKYNFATQVVLMRFIGIALLVAAITSVSNGFMVTDANKRKNEAQSVDFTTEPYKDDK